METEKISHFEKRSESGTENNNSFKPEVLREFTGEDGLKHIIERTLASPVDSDDQEGHVMDVEYVEESPGGNLRMVGTPADLGPLSKWRELHNKAGNLN